MLNKRRKSGTASLRYTVLAVGSLIMGMIGTTNAVSYLDLGEEGTPSYGYQPENYNMILEDNGEYKLEKNGETKNLMYGYVSVRGRPFLYYFGYYNDRLGIFQFMDDQPNYNINTVNRIWYNATIYNYATQSGKFISGQGLPSASACNSSKPDNDTRQCYFKLRDNFGEEYNKKIDGMIRNNNNGGYLPCFIYEELNEIVCMDQRTQDSNNYAVYDTTNRYNFETFDNSMGIYPTFIANTTSTNTITLGTCPTIKQLIDAYGSEYNESLCYSAKRLLTDTGIVITTPQSIFELFPTYDEWKEGYNTYKNYCKGTSTEICRQAFSGEQAQRSIYNKAPADTIGLYQYCHLQLEIEDKTQTTCVLSTGQLYATGVNEAIRKESMTNQSAVDIMIGSMVNMENIIPTSGSVLDALKPEGENRKINRNILESIQELYGTFMNLFHYRSGVQGIIPAYITRIILVIVLFAVFKK